MTCDECVHNGACWFHFGIEEATNIEKICRHFKDKRNFVEVVRCKDCTYHYKGVCNYDEADSDLYGYTHFVDEDYFCGDGERKVK